MPTTWKMRFLYKLVDHLFNKETKYTIMMRLENRFCKIQIELDDTYVIGSPNNRDYDITFNPGKYRVDENYNVFRIRVDLRDREYTIALIGDCQSWVENCAVLEDAKLTVLQGWQIIQVDVCSGLLIQSATIDSMGCNYELYKVRENYLIYGEIDITMLNASFQKLWYFSGHDIFACATDKKAFEIKEEKICLYDFEETYYELDYDGNVILEDTKTHKIV